MDRLLQIEDDEIKARSKLVLDLFCIIETQMRLLDEQQEIILTLQEFIRSHVPCSWLPEDGSA